VQVFANSWKLIFQEPRSLATVIPTRLVAREQSASGRDVGNSPWKCYRKRGPIIAESCRILTWTKIGGRSLQTRWLSKYRLSTHWPGSGWNRLLALARGNKLSHRSACGIFHGQRSSIHGWSATARNYCLEGGAKRLAQRPPSPTGAGYAWYGQEIPS